MIRAACAAVSLSIAGAACAQLSGSVALVSDYRYRGSTLSDEKPAAQASIAYDHESGGYGGVFASTVSVPNPGRNNLQTIAFAGYARQLRPGVNWDAGAAFTAFSGASEYRYAEIFCGLASDKLSAKVYYAPNYFGQGARAFYAEFNAALPLRDRLRLVAHVGGLHARNPGSGYAPSNYGASNDAASNTNRLDFRTGAALEVHNTHIELAWVAATAAGAAYPVGYVGDRNAVVLSVLHAF